MFNIRLISSNDFLFLINCIVSFYLLNYFKVKLLVSLYFLLSIFLIIDIWFSYIFFFLKFFQRIKLVFLRLYFLFFRQILSNRFSLLNENHFLRIQLNFSPTILNKLIKLLFNNWFDTSSGSQKVCGPEICKFGPIKLVRT